MSATAYADSLIILSEMTAKVCQTGAVIFVSWNYAYHAYNQDYKRSHTVRALKILQQTRDKKTTASIGLFYCRKVAKEQAKWYD